MRVTQGDSDAGQDVLSGTIARKLVQRGPAVFVMIGDGAIRNHEYLDEVWKDSRVDNAPIEEQQ